MAGLKQWIKNGLLVWQRRQYDRLLEEKTVTYDDWIRKEEAKKYEGTGADGSDGGMASVRQIPYGVCRDYLTGGAMLADGAEVVLFVAEDGAVSEVAENVVADYFGRNSEIAIAYGDEDVMGPEGIRYTPWFKPHWSPDTFLSFFYFGSVFAVRMRALRALTEEEMQWIWREGDKAIGIYRLCYVLAVKSGGFLVRERRTVDGGEENEEWMGESGRKSGVGDGFGFPVGHMDEVLFHARSNCEMRLSQSQPLHTAGCPVKADVCEADKAEGREGEHTCNSIGKISIVIPSKDNAEVLKRCIESVQRQYGKRKAALACEIIVVDNGSAKEVQEELRGWMAEQEKEIQYFYVYKEMPFHFSRMCNMGAETSTGDVLLFLNDDVEIAKNGAGAQHSLLERLYDRAKRGYTGAVGTKLYYPDSRKIQHAGIVNLRLGPVHKLQFKEDDMDYYYGWNRRERNVMAVTGACLAVEKKKYKQAGGFSKELPVAFNDVDFCFTLFEKGYYHVVLQDVVLYHHESMSRGNDDDREKLCRLLGERDKLYARHPRMYGADPFYHKYLAGDMLSTGFELKADYNWNPQSAHGKVRAEEGMVVNAREDACVMVSLEYAGTVGEFLTGGEIRDGRMRGAPAVDGAGRKKDYLLQGYSFVAGSDNACYEKYLIFMKDLDMGKGENEDGVGVERIGSGDCGKTLCIKAEPFIRRDVEANLPDQVNVGMAGFCILVDDGDLPSGTYRVGMMVRDKCSGQKLYTWTNRYLTVESSVR